MSAAFSTPGILRNKTLILLAISVLLAIASAVMGVDDNPPGILCAFLAAAAFVLAFVHHWCSAKKFLLLLLAAVLVFILYIIANIIIDTALQNPAAPSWLRNLTQSPAVNGLSIIIVMICFAAFTVGIAGSIVMVIRNHRRS